MDLKHWKCSEGQELIGKYMPAICLMHWPTEVDWRAHRDNTFESFLSLSVETCCA